MPEKAVAKAMPKKAVSVDELPSRRNTKSPTAGQKGALPKPNPAVVVHTAALAQGRIVRSMSAPFDARSLEFVRQNEENYELQPNAIAIRPVAGSIWGTAAFRLKAYNDSYPPVENIGLFPSSVTRLAVTVCIPNEADISHGDQAGILLYSSDSQWVKLVVEGDKAAGSRMLILAKMPSNADAVSEGADPEASVSKKWTMGCDAPKPVRLQLELRRGAAGCSVIASCDHDEAVVVLPVPFECARFGIMAHLCREKAPFPRGHWFHFSDFALQTNTSS